MSAMAERASVCGEAVRGGLLRSFIGGRWEEGSGERTDDLDPAAPAEPLAVVCQATGEDATRALHAASEAQRAWARTSVFQRAQVLLRAASILRARAEPLARTLTCEEGKPLAESRGEVVRTAETLEVFAGLAYRPRGEVHSGHRPSEQWVMTLDHPLGVVVVLAPWNFPLLIPAWKVAAAVLAGNAVVLKPSEQTPLTAATLVAVLDEAGLPAGVVNLVLGDGTALGPALLRAPADAVTLTGGNATGRVVALAAVEQHLKCQLELGGNNPVLVLADADLDLAAREIVAGAMGSTGQKCTATRRVYADRAVHRPLVDRVITLLEGLRLGHGLEPTTDVGPLVSAAARAAFERAVEDVIATGSGVERFGAVPEDGFFAAPALVRDGAPDHEVFRREVFGPLLAIFGVDGFDEGLARCNDSAYGLSASLFSSNTKAALAFAEGVEAGMVHVNSQTTGAEPHVPFGGMKASSSYTRELGRLGLEWFSQTKSVYLEGS